MLNTEELAANVHVVLEEHGALRAIHPIRRDLRAEYAIAVDRPLMRPSALAELHYALLRAMPRAEVVRVLFFDSDLWFPRTVDDHPIAVGAGAREAAKRRIAAYIPEPEPELPPLPTHPRWMRRRRVVLVADAMADVMRLSREAPEIEFLVEPAFVVYSPRFVDLVIAPFDVEHARQFQSWPTSAAPVVWLSPVPVPKRWAEDFVIVGKLDVSFIRGFLQLCPAMAPLEDPFKSPEPRARTEPRRPRVLVLEKDAPERALAKSMVARVADVSAPEDSWEILDRIHEGAWDRVLCDVAWRTPGFEPMHRLVRRLRPELAERIVLLAARAPEPSNQRVIARPVTKEAVTNALARVASAPGINRV